MRGKGVKGVSQQFKYIHGYVTLKVSDLYEEMRGDPKECAERLMYVMDRVSHQGKAGVVIEYDVPVLDQWRERYCRPVPSRTRCTAVHGLVIFSID